MLSFIVIFVLIKGMPLLSLDFLFGKSGNAHTTLSPAFIATGMLIFLALAIALPLGIGTAIYLNEYAKKESSFAKSVRVCIDTLAGVPSIIFGLFGMMFFGQTLGLSYSLLTGSLTLILMVLPLITRNTQEALKTVPDSYRSGAIGLGAGKFHMIRTILLPSAMPGIITGVILAVGRIVGESAALLFTAGSGKALLKGLSFKFLREKVFQSGGTMTVQLYLSATSEGDFDTAFGVAVVLLVIVFLINLGTKALAKKFDINRVK